MGWVLAGLELETKPARPSPTAPSASKATASATARRIAEEEKIPSLASDEIQRLMEKDYDGVSHLIDVRSEEEFASGHISGSINVPGGQAVQRADDFVPVRNARVVFVSNDSARAVMAAYWYRQMGFKHVYVLYGGLNAWKASGRPFLEGASEQQPLGYHAAEREARFVSADTLRSRMERGGCLILDVGTSLEFDRAHVPGAQWVSRGWIDIKLPELYPDRRRQFALTCSDGKHSVFAARALAALGYHDVTVLDRGLEYWMALDYRTESGLSDCLVVPSDVVLSPSIRGNKEEMQRYLDWELKLKQ